MNARRAPDDPVEWLNRAESSLTQASHLLDGVYLEDLCAAAHQAAEKAIKSVLLKKAVDYPYVHDLGRLLALARDSGVPLPKPIEQAAPHALCDSPLPQSRRARDAREV
jgi:HEPN domain-containing protein